MIGNGIVIGARRGLAVGGAGGAARLYNSLVSFWRLDEESDGSGAVPRADSIGDNDLADAKTVPSVTGLVYAHAADLHAAQDEVLEVASNESVQLARNSSFWVACWVRPVADGAERAFLWKAAAPWEECEYSLRYNPASANFRFYMWNSTPDVYTAAGGTFVDQTWTLVFGMFDGANVMVASNDGDVASTAWSGTPNLAASPLRIGQAYGYTGRIGPAMIGVNYIPTAQDRAWMYNSGAGRTLAEMQAYTS